VEAVIVAVAYYSVLSLGVLAFLTLVVWLWGLALNWVYQQLKATHRFFEYFRYRKEFLLWLKERKPKTIRPKARL